MRKDNITIINNDSVANINAKGKGEAYNLLKNNIVYTKIGLQQLLEFMCVYYQNFYRGSMSGG